MVCLQDRSYPSSAAGQLPLLVRQPAYRKSTPPSAGVRRRSRPPPASPAAGPLEKMGQPSSSRRRSSCRAPLARLLDRRHGSTPAVGADQRLHSSATQASFSPTRERYSRQTSTAAGPELGDPIERCSSIRRTRLGHLIRRLPEEDDRLLAVTVASSGARARGDAPVVRVLRAQRPHPVQPLVDPFELQQPLRLAQPQQGRILPTRPALPPAPESGRGGRGGPSIGRRLQADRTSTPCCAPASSGVKGRANATASASPPTDRASGSSLPPQRAEVRLTRRRKVAGHRVLAATEDPPLQRLRVVRTRDVGGGALPVVGFTPVRDTLSSSALPCAASAGRSEAREIRSWRRITRSSRPRWRISSTTSSISRPMSPMRP